MGTATRGGAFLTPFQGGTRGGRLLRRTPFNRLAPGNKKTMPHCGLCRKKVGAGPKYRKHLTSAKHQSNQCKKMDPEWVDVTSTNVPTRRLEAVGLSRNRWITAEQHRLVMSLMRIAATGIPANCFELTGCTTKMGFCSDDDRTKAEVLHQARTVLIASTKLEPSRFKSLGIKGTMCSEEELRRPSALQRRKDCGLPPSCFSDTVDPVWCTEEDVMAARSKWQGVDWLPEGTNHPGDEASLKRRIPRPYSGVQGRRVSVSFTPTLGGTA